jgi:PAS domain-containing protein
MSVSELIGSSLTMPRSEIEHGNQAEPDRMPDHSRSICDSIPGLICTLTAMGEIEYANGQLLRYLGKKLDDIKGWGTSDVVHSLGCRGIREREPCPA